MFGALKSIEWISEIILLSKREKEIKSCFADVKIPFHYAHNLSEFNSLIQTFQQERYDDYKEMLENNDGNIFGVM